VLWHRRCGKDKVLWNVIIKRAIQNVGTHYYLLPTYTQAKKVVWDGIDNDGFKFLDHIPASIVKNRNATEMKIELVNGSIIQLIGTDNYDAIRGTNPITCVFSEYAYQNPMAWEVVKPILKMNNGLAIFNTTPNGYNHAKELWDIAAKDPDWYTELLTVRDTKLLSEAEIQKEREQGMTEDMINQEYFCSFEAAIKGAYYADELQEVKAANRICGNVYNPDLEVYTAWDIGYRDDTSIIFYQIFGKEIRVIDYYSNSGMTLPEYIGVLRSKSYKYKTHYLPWDARIRPMSSGKSTMEVAQEYGLDVQIAPQLSVNEGIQQVRMILKRCWFEQSKTEELINCLSQYKREYDEQRKAFRPTPYHDWTSHGADAFRYMAISIQESQPTDDGSSAYLNSLRGGNPFNINLTTIK
jgi:phage terminase large subunit